MWLSSGGERYDGSRSKKFGELAARSWTGGTILFCVLFYAYKVVGVFGAGSAVDFLENKVFGSTVAECDLSKLPPLPGLPETDDELDGTIRLVPHAASWNSDRLLMVAEVWGSIPACGQDSERPFLR